MQKENEQDPVVMIGAMQASIDDFLAKQKELHVEAGKLITDGNDASALAVEKVNNLADDLGGIVARMTDMEQKAADNVVKGTVKQETLGQMVIKSTAYKEFAQGKGNSMKFQANTIIGQEGSPLENAGTIVAPDRLNTIIPGAFRLLTISDILPQGTTISNNIEYTRELLFTNAAAETNEGVTKPETTLTFELANAPVVTIAHWIKASKQILDDAPLLQSYIDVRMRYGVNLRCDNQLLNGNGTSPNMSGITDTGNHTVFTPTTGENALDSLNRAKYLVFGADYAPTAYILNPADWGAIERLKKQAGTDDSYIIGDPTGVLGMFLWGLPVVLSNNMTEGNFVVAAFDVAYQQFNRDSTTVNIFEQDEDNVQTNLLTIRAEVRKALAVYRAASSYSGALTL